MQYLMQVRKLTIHKTNASMVVEKPTCEMKVIDAKATAASTDHDP
jgi:hypothetical protein